MSSIAHCGNLHGIDVSGLIKMATRALIGTSETCKSSEPTLQLTRRAKESQTLTPIVCNQIDAPWLCAVCGSSVAAQWAAFITLRHLISLLSGIRLGSHCRLYSLTRGASLSAVDLDSTEWKETGLSHYC